MISDFKKHKDKYFENKCEGAERPSPRERSDRAGGSVWEGCPPPTVGRFFNFGGQNHVNLVHAVMRFLTLYLIRIWIKIIPYSRTHTETGSEKKGKKSGEKKSAKVIIFIYRPVVAH